MYSTSELDELFQILNLIEKDLNLKGLEPHWSNTTLTPCTLAYDHITQPINNLANCTQQITLYAMEENASLFTSDTATPCNFNITEDTPDLEINSECKSNSKILLGIHLQSKHKYRNAFGDSNIQYHASDNGDALTFKDKYTALLQQELQNPYWCLHDPITTKVIRSPQKWTLRQCPMQCIFQAILKQLPKLIMSHTRQ